MSWHGDAIPARKYQMTIAKLPLAKDLDEFDFDAAAINKTLVRKLAAGGFHGERPTRAAV